MRTAEIHVAHAAFVPGCNLCATPAALRLRLTNAKVAR